MAENKLSPRPAYLSEPTLNSANFRNGSLEIFFELLLKVTFFHSPVAHDFCYFPLVVELSVS